MVEEAEKLSDLVSKLNMEFYQKTKYDDDSCFEFVTTGSTQLIVFLGTPIWDSEDDERADWSEEPIETFVRDRANHFLEKLQGIQF